MQLHLDLEAGSLGHFGGKILAAEPLVGADKAREKNPIFRALRHDFPRNCPSKRTQRLVRC